MTEPGHNLAQQHARERPNPLLEPPCNADGGPANGHAPECCGTPGRYLHARRVGRAIVERMIDNCAQGAVWVVWRRDRSHRIRFPGRANAERWLDNHSRQLWEIVPIDDRTEPAEADTAS